MAKKYQAIETKIHWATWSAIAAIVVLMITTLILVQPSQEEIFYNNFQAAATDVNFDKKLPRDNKFQFVNSLDDQWLGLEKGVYSLASRENHVTFVLFGNATNQATIANVANVYARLYGSAETSPVISAAEIYTTLGDDQVSLFYYEIKENQVEGIVNALNDKYEDAEMVIATMPFVIAFLDGNIVDYAVLTEANVPLQLVNFYQSVFDSEAVQKLIS